MQKVSIVLQTVKQLKKDLERLTKKKSLLFHVPWEWAVSSPGYSNKEHSLGGRINLELSCKGWIKRTTGWKKKSSYVLKKA